MASNYFQKQILKISSCKIVADINAIKPVGVEGLGSNDDGKEIKPGVFGIGALAIGKLKIKTETEMIKRATAEPQGLFDYSIAYTIAKDEILKKLAKAAAKSCKISLTTQTFIFFIQNANQAYKNHLKSFKLPIGHAHGRLTIKVARPSIMRSFG